MVALKAISRAFIRWNGSSEDKEKWKGNEDKVIREKSDRRLEPVISNESAPSGGNKLRMESLAFDPEVSATQQSDFVADWNGTDGSGEVAGILVNHLQVSCSNSVVCTSTDSPMVARYAISGYSNSVYQHSVRCLLLISWLLAKLSSNDEERALSLGTRCLRKNKKMMTVTRGSSIVSLNRCWWLASRLD